MSIYLKDIDKNNFYQCTLLTTNKEGKNYVFEEFVASNAFSIAQSKVQKGWTVKAIYNDDLMIGFTMYGYCYDYNFYEVCRFMIDHKYQGKGYGKIALKKVIEEMKKIEDCKDIYISFDPKNNIARSLYQSLGFKDTGKTLEEELLFRLE
ncbi:GNAT family N-acetyltransferase [Clostridium sp. AL.422]|uniref:GNAT family N-acetyltransferase n=1 Tax=Clostridium TaxID=1485 RepID=UPI00293DB3E0|nr:MULTISPECIES: GNAT family N-acetyltransferase [unclassified Clostridium]MDV4152206.1 GNAT family N-acetyltransferase [Clostridium sp. AL.422]